MSCLLLCHCGIRELAYQNNDFNQSEHSLDRSRPLRVDHSAIIGNNNKALWRYVLPRGSVLEGVRATVANRLATDGESWTRVFSRYNSGTYNNQWMVVDNKLFTPHQEQLTDGLLWVLEQIPGYLRRQDLTETLQSRTFWPSYNSPYFPGLPLPLLVSASSRQISLFRRF